MHRSCFALLIIATCLAFGGTVAAGSIGEREDASHVAFPVEWWRVASRLHASDGRAFAFVVTYYRFSIGRGSNQALTAVSTLTDLTSGTRIVSRRVGRDDLGDASIASATLGLRVADWTLAEAPRLASKATSFALSAGEGDALLTLSFQSARRSVVFPALPHFASYTRLTTSGTLVEAGRKLRVTGISWLDHVYCDAAGTRPAWDLYGLHLDDGRDVMVYVTRDRDGFDTTVASIVGADGSIRTLRSQRGRYGVESTPYFWRSDHTGAAYPDISRFSFPAQGLDFSVTPSVADQEIVAGSRAGSYWDGAVDVVDVDSGGNPIGNGFVQRIGY